MPVATLMQGLQQAIRDEAARLGFVSCGFARADAALGAGEDLRQWLAAGYHGTMGWMEARADERASPNGLWSEAQSVIALAMSYAPATDPLALAGVGDRGRISAYAQGGDYHKTVKKGLKALARFIVDRAPSELKVFVDTAPVMEKPLAAAAGIGWQGKHSNLLSRTHGNWLFLGIIMTSLEFEPDPPAEEHCGSCTRCIDGLPDRRDRRAGADRCAGLHFLSDDRAFGPDPAPISRGDGQPHLRLRRLPGGVPVEPLRRGRPGQPRLPAARRNGRAAAGRSAQPSTMRASARCSPDRRSSASA